MKFTTPSKLPDGRYFVKTKNDEGQRVFVQLNKVKLLTPFAEGDDVTIQTDYDFTDHDNLILAAAKDNSTAWFGREVQQKTIDAAYQRSVMNQSMNVDKFSGIRVYDASKELLDPNSLEADTVCDCVIELVGVWFMKKTFGCHWRVVQVRKKKELKPNVYSTYLFTDDQEESGDEDSDDETTL
jgi:hypothetical protein